LCGIAGFTHSTRVPDPSLIRQAIECISHRGPDRRAVFETRFVSMGAARLRIIDLESGDQPMTAENGDVVIAFNGEVYNHAELRAELEGLGHRFESRTDTEAVLRAFLQWDTGCFSRLRGMFALAIWQESGRRLVLARDRMGIKPLYLARRGDELYFGSELKTIFVHPEIERRLDPAGLDCWLSLNYVPCPLTLVEGIEKLPPGHWMEWSSGKVQTEAYWSLPFGNTSRISLEDAEERLDGLLKRSVHEHLLSDVPLGMWLSGGADSSTILHYACEQSGAPLRTFSISFLGRSFDESDSIARLVSHYGTVHEQLDLNPELDLADAIEEFAGFADEPNGDAGALPVWYLSRMTRRTATVALSGEGADELFGGYATYRADELARRARLLPSFLLRAAEQVAQRWPVSDEKISFEYKLKRFLAGCQMRPEQAHVFWNGTFSFEEKRLLTHVPLTNGIGPMLHELAERGDNLAAYLWFDQKYYLPDNILAKVDRMSMAHSVEVRPPFLDHRIVEFSASLPESLKVRGTLQKLVLRSLMKKRLPPVLGRRKVGFDIPAHEWLRGPLRPLLEQMRAEGDEAHGGLLRRGVLDQHIDGHLSRRVNVGYHLWGMLILFLWMRKWQIRTNGSHSEPLRTALVASTGT
jgi:asparagine synthase (glutamine-hydrolysing)